MGVESHFNSNSVNRFCKLTSDDFDANLYLLFPLSLSLFAVTRKGNFIFPLKKVIFYTPQVVEGR